MHISRRWQSGLVQRSRWQHPVRDGISKERVKDRGLACRMGLFCLRFPSMLNGKSLLLSILFSFLLPVARAADLVVPDDVIFDRNVEYANPGDQHLMVNIARPKTATGPCPAILCIHGGGF